MDFISSIIWTNLLFHFILMVVLIGILILEKFDWKEYQRGIVPYILVCSFIALFMVVDTLRFLEFMPDSIILWANPFLTMTIMSFILWNSYNIGKNTSRILSFVIFGSGIVIAFFEIMKIISNSINYWLFGSISTFIATMLIYFLIINFLIKRRKGCDND